MKNKIITIIGVILAIVIAISLFYSVAQELFNQDKILTDEELINDQNKFEEQAREFVKPLEDAKETFMSECVVDETYVAFCECVVEDYILYDYDKSTSTPDFVEVINQAQITEEYPDEFWDSIMYCAWDKELLVDFDGEF